MLKFFITFISMINLSLSYEEFLSNVSGEIGKENFTYYSMMYDGSILIELISVTGDCDLYVSQKTLQPDYEPDSYCLQSATCGLDTVIVPKSFKRPIGIGVFGHPSHELSSYHLMFYRIDDAQDIFNYDEYSDSKSGKHGGPEESPKDDKYSFIRFFLKILIQYIIEVII